MFIMLAFVAAFLVTHNKSQQVGIHPVSILACYAAAGVGGLAGGRVLYSVAVDPGLWGLLSNPLRLISGSGFAMYGGLIGGTIAVALVALQQGIPTWKLADIAAPSVLIGMGVGRLGCFFAGCCHGGVAPRMPDSSVLMGPPLQGVLWSSNSFPFVTAEFQGGVGRLLHQPLYPTQLWAFVSLVGLSALLLAVWDYRRFDGQMAALALLIEPLFRGTIEVFRADHRGTAFQWEVSEATAAWFPGMTQAGGAMNAATMGLTTSQTIGGGMVLCGAMIYAARRHAGVAEEIPFDPDDDFDDDT
jgi:phosphatidylglycerol:prolipoprotein diacylglycerol transferase